LRPVTRTYISQTTSRDTDIAMLSRAERLFEVKGSYIYAKQAMAVS